MGNFVQPRFVLSSVCELLMQWRESAEVAGSMLTSLSARQASSVNYRTRLAWCALATITSIVNC